MYEIACLHMYLTLQFSNSNVNFNHVINDIKSNAKIKRGMFNHWKYGKREVMVVLV